MQRGRRAGSRRQFQIAIHAVHRGGRDAIGVEHGRQRLARHRCVEAVNPLGARHTSHQGGLDQPLKIHGELESHGAQLAPEAGQASARGAFEKQDPVDERIIGE